MCEGIVDFGDPIHIQSCIQAETSNNDMESYFASYKSSFEMGVQLAGEILAPDKRQAASNQHIDEALRARDPLFVLGLAATMADSTILQDKEKQEQEELARLAAKQKEIQEESALPPQLTEQALSVMSGMGRQAMETMSAFVRPPVESSISEPILTQSEQLTLPSGPERIISSPSHASAHFTAGHPLQSSQQNLSVSPYHHRLPMSALSSATSSPQPSRTVTPAMLSPFQAQAVPPPVTPTPVDQSPVVNPFVISPT